MLYFVRLICKLVLLYSSTVVGISSPAMKVVYVLYCIIRRIIHFTRYQPSDTTDNLRAVRNNLTVITKNELLFVAKWVMSRSIVGIEISS